LIDGTQIGPVVSQSQLDENMAYMELARAEGGEVICGGERVDRDTDGYYMTPAVVAGTSNDWRINRVEMFAPIACVIKADSYDEALHLVNDTHFGLTSGIITRDLARASHFRRNARTGCVMVNLPTAGTDYHVPFGGRGSSSYGTREQGGYAEEFYTTVKTAYISSGMPS
ncbi:MAG: aldehyde dehydrogenase family protein, partial [SAR116 cluster bacterium]|nr:aldehyde dehydrogenase family protein [SAR116 cluster bacterium]